MAKTKSKHPLDLIHQRLWADDIHEIVRELQRNQMRPVSEKDVLDFLFGKNRADPETAELVRQILRSVARAVELNRRITAFQRRQHDRLEEALYEEDSDDDLDALALLEAELLSQH